MKKLFLILAAAISLPTLAQTDTLKKVHIGFVHPLSTNGQAAPQLSNRYALHLLSGVSRSQLAVGIAGISQHIKRDAKGLQIAGLVNTVGGHTSGVQMAGLANMVRQDAKGVQIAGLTNRSNRAEVQISGLVNAAKEVNTLQVAGLVNVAEMHHGVQISGLFNRSADVHLQAAGLGNVARDVRGVQLGGLFNKARKVKGVQIAGLINVADSSDYPIALINLIKNGKQKLGVSLDETNTSLVTYRSGGGVMYGLVAIGYNASSENYALETGVGAYLINKRTFGLSGEVFSQWLTDFANLSYRKHGLRLIPTLRISRVELFAGPSIAITQASQDRLPFSDSRYFWTKAKGSSFTGLSLGYIGGLQVTL